MAPGYAVCLENLTFLYLFMNIWIVLYSDTTLHIKSYS